MTTCLAWRDAITSSLSAEGLMMPGRVVLSFLLCNNSAGEGVLLSSGVDFSWSRARYGSDPSLSHLLSRFLMVCTCLSMKPWPLG